MSRSSENEFVKKKDLEAVKKELLDKLASKEEIAKLATKKEIAKLATKEEISKLATKEEINKLSTKEEISKLSTKEEISKLATKEELKELATKAELKKLDEKTDRIIGVVVQMQERMDTFETKADAEKRMTTIITAIDGLAAKVDNISTEMAAVNHGLLRHEDRLEDHENRIHELEVEKV